MNKSEHLTIVDVAKALNVSVATISRVVNNRPGVGPELRKKVMAEVKRLKYAPSVAAKNLSRSKSDTLGVVFQDINTGWFLDIYRGILNRGACTNFHLLTAVSERPGDEYDVPHRLLSGQRVDGLIWLDPRASPKTVEAIRKLGQPLVMLQYDSEGAQINTVSIENTHGAMLAIRHLLSIGYRRLMLMTGGESDLASRQKTQGVYAALKEAGVEIAPACILNGHNNGDLAIKAMEEFMRTGHPMPEAIFCYNDDMALALLFWLRKQHIRVPEDIALMGFDGIEEGRRTMLSTIATPLRVAGLMATQLLIDIISHAGPGERPPQQILLKGSLCIRETCGAALRLGATPSDQ